MTRFNRLLAGSAPARTRLAWLLALTLPLLLAACNNGSGGGAGY